MGRGVAEELKKSGMKILKHPFSSWCKQDLPERNSRWKKMQRNEIASETYNRTGRNLVSLKVAVKCRNRRKDRYMLWRVTCNDLRATEN